MKVIEHEERDENPPRKKKLLQPVDLFYSISCLYKILTIFYTRSIHPIQAFSFNPLLR